MIWQVVLPILISTVLSKNNVSSRLYSSIPIKHGRLLDFTSTALMVVSVIYSVILPLRLDTIWFIAGLLIYLLALVILIATAITLRHSEIDRPFTSGMYRYSRHPFYLSMGLIYISITIMTLSWLYLILSIFIITQLLIAASNEERYCLKIYGEEYQEYLERTPRWIGLPKLTTH